MIMKNIVFWFVGLILVSLSYGCYIQGTDSGTCDARLSSEPDYKKLEMPFCGPIIDYTPCVPEQKAVNPDRNFNQDGRWANHTTLTKDRVTSINICRFFFCLFFFFFNRKSYKSNSHITV
mmetsp:Transcript_45493/g.58338  ORF Transcript_45493/g.58338 Transcript_45493/m.58338 type:complete len:120 (+) Transcript_45493:81-440(+)